MGKIGLGELEYKAGMCIGATGMGEVGVWGSTEEWGNRYGKLGYEGKWDVRGNMYRGDWNG